MYLRDDFERFLTAIDEALSESCEIVVVGGSAAALRYGVTQATEDIDTYTTVSAALEAAAARAREVTGLQVPLGFSGQVDGPYEFEDRLERILPGLRRLVVKVPEKHDLVLMKGLRADEHDLAAIEEIHAHSRLNLETLVQRFTQEMSHTIINPKERRARFLMVVERLFPESVDRVAAESV